MPCFSSTRPPVHLDLHSFPTRRSSDLADHSSPAAIADGLKFSVPVFSGHPHFDVDFGIRGRLQCRGHAAKRWHRQSGWLRRDRKSTRLNSSHQIISYAVFCLKKKTMAEPSFRSLVNKTNHPFESMSSIEPRPR